MGRCRCGAALVPDLHFCVACGARQDVGGRVAVGAGAPVGPSMPQSPVRPRPAVGGPLPGGPAFAPLSRPVPPSPPRAAALPPGVVPPMALGAPGVPAGPARSTVPWIVAGVAVVVAVVLVAVGVLAARPAVIFGAPAPASVATPTVTVGVPVPAPASSDTASTPTTASASSGASSSRESASAALEAQVVSNRSTVEGLVGQWVPQLSAKRDGLVADGITYDDDAILAHYSSLLTRDPSAVMLWSGDWPVFNGSDFWVVVHPQGFSTAAAANAWCDAQGYSADDCFAKKLSHSGGPSGTTVQR